MSGPNEPIPDSGDSDPRLQITSLLRQLPEKTRMIAELSLAGKTTKEIADLLQMSVRTVQAHRQKGVALLKELLSTDAPEPTHEPDTAVTAPNPKANDTEFVLEIELPDGLSDAEILNRLSRASLLADDLHRACGGHGVKVKELEFFAHVAVPEVHNV